MNKLIYSDLETKRLILRKPIKSDYIHQFNYFKDKNNFLKADLKVADTMKDIEAFFDRMNKSGLEKSIFWMIALKSNNQPIGTLSAWNIDWENMVIEFGYSLYPEFRGKRYMAEALEAAIKFLNEINRFTTFDIWTDSNNLPSIKLAKRLGFKYEGIVIEDAKYSNNKIDYATFRLNLKG